MLETEIIRRIHRQARRQKFDRSLALGIGDDCAIYQPRTGEDMLFTTDFVIEGRHFLLTTHRASDIGHKALARSLSDLAAMGGQPAFCLVSLAVPAQQSTRWIDGFYSGLLSLADKHRATLAGGDLSQSDKTIVDVMCAGRVPRGKAMRRDQARIGDDIYVTGVLGESALGLQTMRAKAWRRHLRPQPRLAAGQRLRALGVRAAMDLSDGLSLDLLRLCEASKVGAALSSPLPVARGATLQQALHGGEDYELLFTASPRLKIPTKIGDLRVSKIGTVVKSPQPRIMLDSQPLTANGFDHFR